jgi:uncharacterized protein DUF4238
MAEHKAQHFIPQTYLKAWCDPNTPSNYTPYVWRFNKDGSDPRKKAPENIFQETDMYTIKGPNGERDLCLEKGLSGLESDFTAIREGKLKQKQPLTEDKFFIICTFVAAMQARTKAMRSHQTRQWAGLLEMMDKMKEQVSQMSLEERKRLASSLPHSHDKDSRMEYDQVKAMVERPLQKLMVPIIEVVAPLLAMMNMIIFETEDEPGFITSDHPCVWFDPEAYKRHPAFRSPGLGSPSIEVTLPISPKQTIVLHHKDVDGYLDAPTEVVEELNRRVRVHAHEYFIVNINRTKDSWFQKLELPKDAWENVNSETDPAEPS